MWTFWGIWDVLHWQFIAVFRLQCMTVCLCSVHCIVTVLVALWCQIDYIRCWCEISCRPDALPVIQITASKQSTKWCNMRQITGEQARVSDVVNWLADCTVGYLFDVVSSGVESVLHEFFVQVLQWLVVRVRVSFSLPSRTDVAAVMTQTRSCRSEQYPHPDESNHRPC